MSRDMCHIMIELVRASILDKAPQVPKDKKIDWDDLKKMSVEAGVLTWVWDSITKLPELQQPIRFQKVGWALSAQVASDRYYKQKEVLRDLIEICRQNDMRLMLLKGIGISELYPKPEFRSAGDLDIFLFDDFDKGNKLFLLKNDSAETRLHLSFDYKGIHIENHKTLIFPNTKTKRIVNKYLMSRLDAVELNDDGYYVLSPIDNFIYLIMHAMNHVDFNEKSPFLAMRNIIDLSVYLNHYRTKWNPENVKRLMQRMNLSKTFDLVVYFAEMFLDVEIPEYHSGTIKKRDIPIIRELFLEKCFREEIPNKGSWIQQFYRRLHRYGRLMKIYKYMPKHKDSFIYSVIRDQLRSMGFRRKVNRKQK